METLEALQKILDDAPEGATNHYFIYAGCHKISNFIIADTQEFWDGVLRKWVDWGGCFDGSMRSLADIQRIVDLMTLNQNMHTTVAGYLSGKDWAHWNEFNAGKFKL